jgi:hypothetical protein
MKQISNLPGRFTFNVINEAAEKTSAADQSGFRADFGLFLFFVNFLFDFFREFPRVLHTRFDEFIGLMRSTVQ